MIWSEGPDLLHLVCPVNPLTRDVKVQRPYECSWCLVLSDVSLLMASNWTNANSVLFAKKYLAVKLKASAGLNELLHCSVSLIPSWRARIPASALISRWDRPGSASQLFTHSYFPVCWSSQHSNGMFWPYHPWLWRGPSWPCKHVRAQTSSLNPLPHSTQALVHSHVRALTQGIRTLGRYWHF